MKIPTHKKLVLFGAGKIGRSFIAPLFSRGGYEVVFIDVFKPVIHELNRRGNYNVVIKGDAESVISIHNVRGVFGSDNEKVAKEVASARIVAVSVGFGGLKSISSSIANGLLKRYESKNALPLDIIIAENLRDASQYLKQELCKYLPKGYPLEERVGLIETSIGKMVPIMLKKDTEADILQVFAEPYNTLILDKLAFKNPIPEIEGLAPKENMKAWVDRKLFIHNLGHATVAYLGFLALPSATFLYTVLADNQLRVNVRDTMLQAANILMKKYPGEFTVDALIEHIDDLIYRFQNKALADTLFRVGCGLRRKLSAEDRIAGAIHLARKFKLPYDLILNVLVCGCHFKATDEEGNQLADDIEFGKTTEKKGIAFVLTSICGFDKFADSDLIAEAIRIENNLINLSKHKV